MSKIGKVKEIAKFAYEHTNFYHNLYNELNINVDSINSIKELPIVSPEDLRMNASGFKSDLPLYKVSMTSGTVSLPKIVYRTKSDFNRSVHNEVVLLKWAGVAREDVVCVAQPFGINGYGELTLAACEQLGIFVVPIGDTSDEALINCIDTFGVTVLDITPSRLIHLIGHKKFDISKSKIRLAIVAGEYINKTFAQYIQNKYGIQVINQFGSTECDCLAGEKNDTDGMFRLDDDFIFEEVDGQLVITSLYHKGTPLIRYHIGDNVKLQDDKIVLSGRSESYQLFDGIKLDSQLISSMVESYGGLQWQCLIYMVKHKLVVQFYIKYSNYGIDNSKLILNDLERSFDFWKTTEYIQIKCCCTNNFITNGKRKFSNFIDLRKANDVVWNSLIEYGHAYEFYYSLPTPLTDNRMRQVITSISQQDFDKLWNIIISFTHIWTPKSRRFLLKTIELCINSYKEIILFRALKMATSDDWEEREESAKLIGMIIKADFYTLIQWVELHLNSNDEKIRRAMLVGIKYCAQYETESKKHEKLINLLDVLLYDNSNYVLKSFDSFTIGDCFLNICPDIVDNKLSEWLLLNDININCKIIRVFKSSGGVKNFQMANKYIDYFSNDKNPHIRKVMNATIRYLHKHYRSN